MTLQGLLADIDRVQSATLDVSAARARAVVALGAARSRGISVVSWAAEDYPTSLSMIADPPPVLWVTGDLAALAGPTVALVGARAASAYAREVAGELGSGLAERGVVVVSGLARGVDGAAHDGALAVQGRTVALLGSGVDIIYPQEHKTLAQRVRRHGILVSELLPGTPPKAAHFPQRNRLISGLSRVVVVVEASQRSGSLITARLALEQGREVMGVPGNILSGRNRGVHALLRDGAKIVEGVDDILEECWAEVPAERGNEAEVTNEPLFRYLLPGESYGLDELIALSGVDGPTLLPRLLELELAGLVARHVDGCFSRTAARHIRTGMVG
jgi:DNA processing protein